MSETEIIAMLISIISITIAILSFFFGRKDKSNKDTEKNSYNQGRLDQTLKNIMEKLDKIEQKLNLYDSEIEIRIEKALKNHVEIYHKGE